MQEYNIPDILKGDTYDGVEFEVLVNSVAKDLTSTVIRCMFRRETKKGAVVKTVFNGSGITKTDAANGLFQIDSFTVDFPVGTYYYDIQFNDSGVIKTYVGGTWNVIQDVTT